MGLKKIYYISGIVVALAAVATFFVSSMGARQSSGADSQNNSCGDGSFIFGDNHCVNNPKAPIGPRETLESRGTAWSDDNYFNALRDLDKETITLFLDGGMPACSDHRQETGLSVPLTLDIGNGTSDQDLEWFIKTFKAHGCDLNSPIYFGEFGYIVKCSPLTEIAAANGKVNGEDLHDIAYILIKYGAKVENSIKEVENTSDLTDTDKASAISFLRSLNNE